MKNILLATDLTSNSDRAMERALKIAKEHKAKLHIVHVALSYTGPECTEHLIHGYLYDYKDSSYVETEITAKQGGEVFLEILDSANTNKIDLIIMGMHGKEKFRDLFVGTTVERVICKGIKPVLMVKEKPAGPYQSVMAAVDFTRESRSALRVSMELAPNAVFCAIHVYKTPAYYGDELVHIHNQEDTEEAKQKVMNAFLGTERGHFSNEHDGEEKRLSGNIVEGLVTDTLMGKAKTLKADLITIGTRGQAGFIPKLGRIEGDILSDPPCDVLVATE